MSEQAPTSAAPAAATTSSTKPSKPDEEVFKAELAKAEKEHEASRARLAAAKAKLDSVQNNKDSPQGQHNAALRKEMGEIREKHAVNKKSRQQNMDVIKKLDDKLKSIMNEQKTARSKVNFKSVEEIDQQINNLRKQVDTGTMRLVDEKKALEQISSMQRLKKSFDGFSQQQKQIDDIKAQISELKKGGDTPEAKALNERYDKIKAELDEDKKKSDHAYKNFSTLRDEKQKAQADQQEKFKKMREIQDTYHQARRAFVTWDKQQQAAKRERYAAEQAAFQAGKRREIAQQKLEEASAPAWQEEIITANGLIRHFDPNAVIPKEEEAKSSGFAAVAQRTVDDSAFKGSRVLKKKEEEDYFAGTGGKKKKGKGGKEAAGAGSTKFNLSVDVIESLARIGIDPPTSQSQVPIVITKLKEKIDFWKGDSDRKTKENIAKAKKEIEKLEAESSPSAPANINSGAKDTHKKPADANQGANGEAVLKQEEDGAADATAELEKAKIEDAAE
ncbi:hypothetical protein BT63DRAFT_205581 [Microthyrium microscopicum]|uniref:Nuclear segregation protein n=1 Tax=Microthyrium microscopicum TaxID=703497 RepID=A0A6A6UGQ2_9PEZI|nr:hypothetical protein BT63DRAFT_205581 [Microthyrium microscopicum]